MHKRPQEKTFYRSFASVDLDAVAHNFDVLSRALPEGVKKMAIVKADAYGHGAVAVARALEERADYFGVACIEEALELRDAGIRKPILILSYTAPNWYGKLIEEDITATIFDLEDARALSRCALSMEKTARVHIAVDTGMGRIGFLPDERGADAVKEICLLEGIRAEGIFSHYACADSDDLASAREQTGLFLHFSELLKERGIQFPLRHICNSAAAMRFPEKFDMCRLGIALYGFAPSEEMDSSDFDLLPAMEVMSHVICVKDVEKGTRIGYGHIYTSPEKKRIATVSIGYADGYNRCITGKGYVLIHGKKAPLVGRICMDQIMVDVSGIPEVTVGDTAVILGKSGEEKISAELLGEWANSFHYEVVCTFLPRVTRIHYRDGKQV